MLPHPKEKFEEHKTKRQAENKQEVDKKRKRPQKTNFGQ